MSSAAPHLYYPQDSLRGGLAKIKDVVSYNHPLEEALHKLPSEKAAEKKNFMRITQGVHAAMRVNMEQTILSQYRRLPGLHSELVGLEVMGMANEQIGFEDFLNVSKESMEMALPLHERMESQLGVVPLEPYHAPVSKSRF